MKFVSIEKEEILIENMAKVYCKAFEKTNFNEMIERMKRHVEYADFKGIVAIMMKMKWLVLLMFIAH